MSDQPYVEGEKAALRFVPHRLTADGGLAAYATAGHYELVARPAPYTYVPVAPPDDLGRLLSGLSTKTLFTIVTPVYNTAPELLRAMIASVELQWYPHWELILVDDNSTLAATRDVLDMVEDPRISVVRLDQNRGISGATNVGIERAVGDFVVFLDHDDELTTDCLFELAVCIDREDPDYVYSDEDKIGPDGDFREPFFKPDWSPDAMMSTMITCHVSCVRRSLAKDIGGLRNEYDGAQDWDFVLRVVERANQISHIPRVLYHWREIPSSIASAIVAKPYAVDAARRAREDALSRRGQVGSVDALENLSGYFRVSYKLIGDPLFSIVIPSKDNGSVLRACIESIFRYTNHTRYEIIIMDNGTTCTQTLEYLSTLRDDPRVKVIGHPAPFNYSEINNIGAKHASGSILVFLNDDTEVVSPDWLVQMGGYSQLPHVGAVGAKLVYPGHGTMQHAGVVNLPEGPGHAFWNFGADSPGYFTRNLHEHNWLAVTGACLMVERTKFDAVGGFDEDLPVAYNDVALCFSLAEHGFYQVVCPNVQLIHHESLTRGMDQLDAKKLERLEREKHLLYQKHPAFYMRDPFYNVNLDSQSGNFSVP